MDKQFNILIWLIFLFFVRPVLGAGGVTTFTVNLPESAVSNNGSIEAGRYHAIVKEKLFSNCELEFYQISQFEDGVNSDGRPLTKPVLTIDVGCHWDNKLVNEYSVSLLREGNVLIIYFETPDYKTNKTRYIIGKLNLQSKLIREQ